MKIVLANRLLDRPGGEQKQFLKLAQFLRRRGHDVVVVTNYHDEAGCYPMEQTGLEIRSVHRGRRIDAAPATGTPARVAARVRAERVQASDGSAWAALVPDDAELINWHGANPQPGFLFSRRRGHRGCWVWMCNDLPGPVYEIAAHTRITATARNRDLYAKVVTAAPGTLEAVLRAQLPTGPITVLDETNAWWWRHLFRREAIVVPWGLEYERLYRPIVERRDGEPLRVLAAGIMSPFRRFEDTVDAVAIVRRRGLDVRLLIVGEPADAAYVNSLRDRAWATGHGDAIEIRGFLPGPEYERVRSTSHVLVLTTKGQTWGQVTTECAAAGIPSIINETATTLELFRDGHATLVSRFAQPESVASALERLARDEPLRRRIAANAQKVVSMLSWDRYCFAMEEVFTRRLAGAYG